jgi:hypothetical protein
MPAAGRRPSRQDAARAPASAELGDELGLHPRGVSDFLDALVAMKFLDREGDGPAAKYVNTPAGALYLDRNSPRYVGGILEMLNARLFKFWHDLPDALRTGKPLPKADVITMGMILHDWNLEKKMHLIRAAYDALPPGGALVAIEALIDDARRENVFGLLMSLNMLIEFGDAFDHSGADFRRWCGEVGFKRFEVVHLAGPSSAAVAYK